MSAVIREYVRDVVASDIHHYPGICDVDGDIDFLSSRPSDYDAPDWIITNPPFGQAADMARHALSIARVGVAFLLRLQFLESEDRFALFQEHPPIVAQFVERVPMCEGGYDPQCSTATAYAWFVWEKVGHVSRVANICRARPGDDVWLPTLLIPPGRKRALFNRDIDLKLATRCVPGFTPPSTIKKASKAQASLMLA